MRQLHGLRRWIKEQRSPLARVLYRAARSSRTWALPTVPVLHGALYTLHTSLVALFGNLARALWYTPLFRSRLAGPAPDLYLYSGMPFVAGPVEITLGRGCRVSGQTTITGRTGASETPRLVVGDNCDIGWQTTIAVGRVVSFGNNVRLAGRCFLAGYPGHPLDPEARAAGLPETDDQVGDIILEDDVWLATGVGVMAGVRIGRGTIVAAGSVVTRDLPAMVLAAGVPARPVRQLGADGGAEARRPLDLDRGA